MIILEGCDNSGKTTLAKRLAQDLGYTVIHSPGPMDQGPKMADWLFQQILMSPKPYIYDRISLISDYVYAPIIRGMEDYYTRRGLDEGFKSLIANIPHIIIFCRPSDQVILNNQDREQMDGVLTNHEHLVESYDELILDYVTDVHMNVATYNYELGESHYRDILERVDEVLLEYGKLVEEEEVNDSDNICKTT